MQVSSADRVIYPNDGLTKGQVVAYYAAVGERMLRHVAGRPLTLERYPKGIAEKGFMQKNVGKHFPDSIGRMEMPKRDGVTVHPVVHDVDGIVYLANQGTLTFHAPASRPDDVRQPGRLVLDLDPSIDDAARTRAAAEAVREFLDALELPSYPLATGSKGYHLIVPVRDTSFEETSTLAHRIATLLSHQHPDLLTFEFLKRDRGDRVLVDWMRNGWWATSVVPWSLRPRPGAPVAVPLAWTDVRQVESDSVGLIDAVDRADPWPELEPLAVDLRTPLAATSLAMDTAGIELKIVDRFGRERPTDSWD